MAAGVQKLHLALAVPLISPFELQHQIFREHPAPEQLFLIATSQHCCPCLYINIYTVPRTEHQSPALLPPPVPGRASPSTAARGRRPGRRVAVPRWAPGPAVPLPLRGAWLDAPVPCDRPPPAAHAMPPRGGAGRRERSPARFPRRTLLSPPPAVPGAASHGVVPRPGRPSPGWARTDPPRCCCLGAARLWRPWAEVAEMQRDGLERAGGVGRAAAGGWVLERGNPATA